jgi:hypothetical protein
VCREWREVATLGTVEATLDLEPRLKDPSDSSTAKEQLFFKACPQLRKLTYHVSPWVPLAQVSPQGHSHAAGLSCRDTGLVQQHGSRLTSSRTAQCMQS